MLTVGDIATQAFTGVAQSLSAVIQTATLTRSAQQYNPTSGTVVEGSPTEDTSTGRCVWANERAVKDAFPHLEVLASDQLVYLIETDFAPQEGDTISAGGRTARVLAVLDLLNVGEMFAVAVR